VLLTNKVVEAFLQIYQKCVVVRALFKCEQIEKDKRCDVLAFGLELKFICLEMSFFFLLDGE